MKEKLVKVSLMIGYLLFFLLMDFWFESIRESFNTAVLRGGSFDSSRYILMMLMVFFKWFVLGLLLHFLSGKKKLAFSFDIVCFIVAIAIAVVFFLIIFHVINPISTIYGNVTTGRQLIYLIPIFSGFFMFEGLFLRNDNKNESEKI
ncbi:hypothetical protein Awo_c10080 [Acetobacterium woodii DSM 1030]|uniref:Uncharacterized protein n=2 Tax=Acetobacterium woodii TaxID=33952 RepID=H6LCL2_ACEWD|nr:hypothetical protein Awo_c10080 [Acetobacterium woodii DSM 1030]